MVRSARRSPQRSAGSPHPRGDGPKPAKPEKRPKTFSPPAWGWSGRRAGARLRNHVLPTRVGMVRVLMLRIAPGNRSPHPRGDGPHGASCQGFREKFSPPAWGWSGMARARHVSRRVLPTRVGMVRSPPFPQQSRLSSPHPRGDGPRDRMVRPEPLQFSPPAWGWSAVHDVLSLGGCVLPTRVGMVRVVVPEVALRKRSPHPRGDGPSQDAPEKAPVLFSPPAWGWSARQANASIPDSVLPTRVGMVRNRTGL